MGSQKGGRRREQEERRERKCDWYARLVNQLLKMSWMRRAFLSKATDNPEIVVYEAREGEQRTEGNLIPSHFFFSLEKTLTC